MKTLQQHAPNGLEPLEVVLAGKRQSSLAGQVQRMEYLIPVSSNGGFAKRLEAFLASDRYEVERSKGDKVRRIDIRPFVESVDPAEDGRWKVRLRVENGATARLDELGEAWGTGGDVRGTVTRHAMLIECESGWRRPIDAVVEELSRAKGVVG